MNKEQKYTSLELSKKIDELAKKKGIKLPESEYCWKNYMLTAYNWQKQKKAWLDDESYEQEQSMSNQYDRKLPEDAFCIPAYDTSELGEMLDKIKIDICRKPFVRYAVDKVLKDKKMIDRELYFNTKTIQDDNLAEAMGKMYFYLLDNNLL